MGQYGLCRIFSARRSLRNRVAGARDAMAERRRPRAFARALGNRPHACARGKAVGRVTLSRRRAFRWLLLPAAQWLIPAQIFASTIASARLWPAQEYTR